MLDKCLSVCVSVCQCACPDGIAECSSAGIAGQQVYTLSIYFSKRPSIFVPLLFQNGPLFLQSHAGIEQSIPLASQFSRAQESSINNVHF